MKRAAALLLLVLSACGGQDPALLVTVDGPFIVPTNADALQLDVVENQQVIKSRTYALTPETPLPVSVTVVESGASHPHVKVNAILQKSGRVVGRGTADADFQGGETVELKVQVSPQ